MNGSTSPGFASLHLGEPQAFRNIAVLPIIGPSNGAAHWLTLGEALEQQLLTVTEVSQGGSVPELLVINRADHPVLLLDGEELMGAKQNRVLNTTILLKEHSETVVPVSCTEQGRWSYVSAAFSDSKSLMARQARARKSSSVSDSLAASAGYMSNQSQVWEDIASLQSSTGTTSATGAMQDVFKAREKELEQCMAAFTVVPGQTGLIVLIDDQVAGFDFIPQPEIYARQHAKLVKSYVIDSIAETQPRPASPETAAAKAATFLRAAEDCPKRSFPSIGYGTDWRYQTPGVAGSALIHEDQVVHAAFFSLANEAQPSAAAMASLRARRRRYTEQHPDN